MRIFALSLVLASCATLEGAKPPLQIKLESQLLGKKVYAQCALHRAHFFDDPTRDLASSSRPGARFLALDYEGKPLPLVAKSNRVHPNSIWHVDRISFPTPFESVMRPLRSPRHLPWIHLRNGNSLLIMVVPENLTDMNAITNWFAERFAAEEPAGFARLNPALRSAVTNGRVVVDMTAQQASLALCKADRTFVDDSATPPVQKWIYLHQGGDHRMLVLIDGKATGRLMPLSASALKALESR